MDSIVTSVIEKFKQRSQFGQRKYGTNLDRIDLKFLDWANHMQEELMDAILYLERLKKEYLMKERFEKEDVKKEQLEKEGFGNQCPCHMEKGLPGWCGVAGGGVPGCDH